MSGDPGDYIPVGMDDRPLQGRAWEQHNPQADNGLRRSRSSSHRWGPIDVDVHSQSPRTTVAVHSTQGVEHVGVAVFRFNDEGRSSSTGNVLQDVPETTASGTTGSASFHRPQPPFARARLPCMQRGGHRRRLMTYRSESLARVADQHGHELRRDGRARRNGLRRSRRERWRGAGDNAAHELRREEAILGAQHESSSAWPAMRRAAADSPPGVSDWRRSCSAPPPRRGSRGVAGSAQRNRDGRAHGSSRRTCSGSEATRGVASTVLDLGCRHHRERSQKIYAQRSVRGWWPSVIGGGRGALEQGGEPRHHHVLPRASGAG